LRAILAEDIAITATDGSLKSREDEIGDVRPSPGFTVDYFLSRDADVRMFGGSISDRHGSAEMEHPRQ